MRQFGIDGLGHNEAILLPIVTLESSVTDTGPDGAVTIGK